MPNKTNLVIADDLGLRESIVEILKAIDFEAIGCETTAKTTFKKERSNHLKPQGEEIASFQSLSIQNKFIENTNIYFYFVKCVPTSYHIL